MTLTSLAEMDGCYITIAHGVFHLWPLHGREHTADNCWCHPERLEDQSDVIVHNAEM